ncbi:MAG TPA: tRNA isopentenyl-2-thiomethyl-A-37 hydroxylase MiaE [Steroidobacteraceae bacterium]|jgi:tRNA-(ms[2]io[6]A)-hydroxylase|nr:tRNA isopentenyl-2-thiomethyl-A-37 hydroxylase MiaE [Steroidobacteraceae bacterium]
MNILAAVTPQAWVDAACEGWRELLVDHANCEKKAASSALAMIFAYPQDQALTTTLSRLAREELRHFEQVSQMMRRLQVEYVRQRPGRYAAGLRAAVRQHEPVRKLDLMCAHALIEARSCERFRLLAARLPAPLAAFYESLRHCEARHFELYVRLAQLAADAADPSQAQTRLAELAAVEAELATLPDEQLRFHSGPPRLGSASN